MEYLFAMHSLFFSLGLFPKKNCTSISNKGRLYNEIELYSISKAILPWVIPKNELTQVITRISFIKILVKTNVHTKDLYGTDMGK